ncbi:hypothetical protein BJ741DRAFT_587491 [Chytriomyces cf. hyalinus JEL632]|nr:hypothetical protein BJ741DRAFT_587491 [Chytriomyces cf. hyalinus JEL632]
MFIVKLDPWWQLPSPSAIAILEEEAASLEPNVVRIHIQLTESGSKQLVQALLDDAPGLLHALDDHFSESEESGFAESVHQACVDKLVATLEAEAGRVDTGKRPILDAVFSRGQLLTALGREGDAAALFGRVVTECRELLATGTSDAEWTSFRLLCALKSLVILDQRNSRFPQAEARLAESVHVCEERYGQTALPTLDALSSLARVLSIQGKYDEAEPILSKILEARTTTLGRSHELTMAVVDRLATVHLRQSNFILAKPLCIAYVEFMTSQFGETHPATIKSWTRLAEVHFSLDELVDAEHFYKLCAEYHTIHDPSATAALTALNNLAVCLRDQRKLKDAEGAYMELVQMSTNLLGRDHADTLVYQAGLAQTYTLQNEFVSARAIFEMCVRVSRETAGDSDEDTLFFVSRLHDCVAAEKAYKAV